MCTPVGPHGACRQCTGESTHTLTCCEGHSVSVCDPCFLQLISDSIRLLKSVDSRARLNDPQLYKRAQSTFANVTNLTKQVFTCGDCSKVLHPSSWPSYHKISLPGPRSLPQKLLPGKQSKSRKALQASQPVSQDIRIITPNAQRRLERKAREEKEEREKLRAELEAKREEREAKLRAEAAQFASEQEKADRIREEKRAKIRLERTKKREIERAKKRERVRPQKQSPPKTAPQEEDDVRTLREKLTLAVLQLKQAQMDRTKAEQRELSAVKEARDTADKMTQENHLLRQRVKDAEERAATAMKSAEETIGNAGTLIDGIEKSASERIKAEQERAEQRIQKIESSADERVAAAEERAKQAEEREKSVNDLLKQIDTMVRARAAFDLKRSTEPTSLMSIW